MNDPKLVPVRTLRPNSLFRVCNQEYRLIHANFCRAYVQSTRRHAVVLKDAAGEVAAEFEAPGGKTNISPETMVEFIGMQEIKVDDTGKPVPQGKSHGAGKPAGDSLKRPLKFSTKMGQVIAWLIASKDQTLKALAAKFEITRGCALSYMHTMHKLYGIGFTLNGDTVNILLPAGCADPFNPKLTTVSCDICGATTREDKTCVSADGMEALCPKCKTKEIETLNPKKQEKKDDIKRKTSKRSDKGSGKGKRVPKRPSKAARSAKRK